jgi:hypothetical protein
MADQGASQRRGNDTTTSSPIGQATTLSPQSSSGDTYFDNNLGQASGNDDPSAGARSKTTQVTGIGLGNTVGVGTNEVSSSQGTSYQENSLGPIGGNDIPSLAARPKEIQIWPIGQGGNSTGTSSSQGVYFETSISQISPIGGSTATPSVIYYKLRAKDTGASYVEWVTTVTPLTTASYPGTPVGSLVDLTVMSIVESGEGSP